MLADQIGSPAPSSDLTEDLLRLQKASHRISSILDLDQLIDRIINEIARSFGLVEANIYLHEPDRDELVLACVHGCTMHEKGHCLKVGKEGLVGYVAATGQMRYAPDVREDPYYLPCEASTLSEVAIPLLVENQLVGVFTASHPELNAFRPQQLKTLQTLSSHIAIAIQNARIFQQVREEREQMTREALEARSIQQALLPRSSPFHPRLCRLRPLRSRRSHRRRLVRLHPHEGRLLGPGPRRRVRKRYRRRSPDGRHARRSALPRRSQLHAR